MIRRSAIAGGALLWATPVVQSIGNVSAFGWHQGSDPPGTKCHCRDSIGSVKAVACFPDMINGQLAPSGKTVRLEMTMNVSCSGDCTSAGEAHEFRFLSSKGCVLVPPTDPSSPFCDVHVVSHPAFVNLRVKSVLTCASPHGQTRRCEDDQHVRICFSKVTGSAAARTGSAHGTEPCKN